jgi:dienelactone hydrolase
VIVRLLASALLALLACPLFALVEGELKEKDIKPDGGEKFIIKYALEVPKDIAPAETTDPAKQVGLFLCFHGKGGQAPNEASNVIGIMKGLKILDGYVVLGAKSQGEGWEENDDVEPVTKLAQWAMKKFPINPRRVYTFGMSSGGNFSGVFGLSRPEMIAASIVYGSGVYKRGLTAKNPKVDLPDFYLVMGLDDDEAHKSGSRDTYRRFKELGINVIYREIEGLPHSSHHPPTNAETISWATRLRHKVIPLAKEETELLKPIAKAAKKDGADQAACDAIALVGGFQAGTVVKDLLEHKDPAVRARAAATCDRALMGDDLTAALAKKLKDADAEVRKAAFASLGTAATFRYQVAQDTLCFVLGQKKWDLGEKLLAVQGLTVATRFHLRGFYQDPPLQLALIKALDDDELEVRKAAFAALKPIQDSGYDPEAERTKRKQAMAKWEEWLAKIMGKDKDGKDTAARK